MYLSARALMFMLFSFEGAHILVDKKESEKAEGTRLTAGYDF